MLVVLALTFGTYRVSYGTEVRTLEIQSGARYVYTAQGCFHHDVTRGSFQVEGDSLLLNTPPEDELGADRYRIVSWGDSTFLIEEAELAHFAEEVRAGWRGETASDKGFFRCGGATALKGRPALPSPWRAQMDRPLAMKALTVSGATCTLDAGASNGLRVGTVLAATLQGKEAMLLIRAVSARTALATWGTLELDKPLRFLPGTPLRIATGFNAALPRFLGESFRKGDFVPKDVALATPSPTGSRMTPVH